MVNSGYNFVLIIVGWEIELGGIWNDIVGFIYWFVIIVDIIMFLILGIVIDWLFIMDVLLYIGMLLENKFILNGIWLFLKFWDIFLVCN